VWGIGAVLRAAGGPQEITAACLREDPLERPAVDVVIKALARACECE
jgi:hypothetical protein